MKDLTITFTTFNAKGEKGKSCITITIENTFADKVMKGTKKYIKDVEGIIKEAELLRNRNYKYGGIINIETDDNSLWV
jgi:hypothetical protein